MTDESLSAAHQTAHVEPEGRGLVPNCVQGGKGEQSTSPSPVLVVPVIASSQPPHAACPAAGAQAVLASKPQAAWRGDIDAKDALLRGGDGALVAVASPAVAALEKNGDDELVQVPSLNAHQEVIAAGKLALERRLAALDARLQVLANRQHGHQVGEERERGQEKDSRAVAVETNGVASVCGNPVSTGAGAFKPQLAQQSDVLARKGGARAAAQQQGEETQLKSKNNGGESISGLGLPDVVRELLRDPAILQWRPHEEVYEVMDGEKFEDR